MTLQLNNNECYHQRLQGESDGIIYVNLLYELAAAAAKSLQSCPILCDPIDGSPPGSSVPGILQARTLEWVAISFSNAWKWKVKVKSFSRVGLFATPWTAAYQAPLSMGFSRQEYWSGVPLWTWGCYINSCGFFCWEGLCNHRELSSESDVAGIVLWRNKCPNSGSCTDDS